MTGAALLGAWPGTDFASAQLAVLDALADPPAGVAGHPALALLPARGPAASPVARTLALLEAMPAGLEPHGWRLRAAPDRELHRARALLRDDLDTLAAAAAGYSGPLVVPVLGPWSLGAALWLPRGERVLADPRAVADLAESLAVGLLDHCADLRRRLPGAQVRIGFAEPALADVLRGQVPTFSGRSRLRAVAEAEAGDVLAGPVGAVPGAVVRVPAVAEAVALAARTGADVAVDVLGAGTGLWEAVAETVEAGRRIWLGAVPARRVASPGRSEASTAAAAVERGWREIGLGRAGLADVVLNPAAGLAGETGSRAREALRAVVDAARELAERAAA